MAKEKGTCNDCGGITSACYHTDPEPFGDERDDNIAVYRAGVGLTAKYFLTAQQGKAVQEILNRYVREELVSQQDHVSDENLWSDGTAEEARRDLQKDIDYITELAKLFD